MRRLRILLRNPRRLRWLRILAWVPWLPWLLRRLRQDLRRALLGGFRIRCAVAALQPDLIVAG